MKKYVLAVWLCVFFAGSAFAKTTVLYHTSDTHGFFYPRNGKGGAASLAAVLAAGPKNYLLLDSGDFAEGTIETQRSAGLKAVELMNRLGYHASTVGNHEFAFKDEGFAKLVSRARFSVLAANLTLADGGGYPEGIAPYKIFDVDGVKIAVIGLAHVKPSKPTRRYRLSKPFPALKKALEEVEERNPSAAVVVVLAHDSLAGEEPGHPNYIGEIARQLQGRVQVVLGGHAHRIFQNEYRGGVLFAESGSNFQYVTKVIIETEDETGRFVSARTELIPLETAHTGEDAAIAAYADSLREPGADEVVGQTAAALEKESAVSGHLDTPVDNWVADATCRYAPADVCIHNTGGTRTGLPKGDITRRDILGMYPFNNTVLSGRVSGAFLRCLAADALVPWNRLAYSGMRISFGKTKSGKVKNLKIWVRGRLLEEDKMYTLSVNSYVASSGREGKFFKTLPEGTLRPAGKKKIWKVLEEDLKQGILLPPSTGRTVQK